MQEQLSSHVTADFTLLKPHIINAWAADNSEALECKTSTLFESKIRWIPVCEKTKAVKSPPVWTHPASRYQVKPGVYKAKLSCNRWRGCLRRKCFSAHYIHWVLLTQASEIPPDTYQQYGLLYNAGKKVKVNWPIYDQMVMLLWFSKWIKLDSELQNDCAIAVCITQWIKH